MMTKIRDKPEKYSGLSWFGKTEGLQTYCEPENWKRIVNNDYVIILGTVQNIKGKGTLGYLQ